MPLSNMEPCGNKMEAVSTVIKTSCALHRNKKIRGLVHCEGSFVAPWSNDFSVPRGPIARSNLFS